MIPPVAEPPEIDGLIGPIMPGKLPVPETARGRWQLAGPWNAPSLASGDPACLAHDGTALYIAFSVGHDEQGFFELFVDARELPGCGLARSDEWPRRYHVRTHDLTELEDMPEGTQAARSPDVRRDGVEMAIPLRSLLGREPKKGQAVALGIRYAGLRPDADEGARTLPWGLPAAPEATDLRSYRLGVPAGDVIEASSRLVVTVHDTAYGKHLGQLNPAQLYTRDVERWVCAEADEVICCSNHVRSELVGPHYDVSPERISVIPCGVAEDEFEVDCDMPMFRRTFVEPGELLVAYVGRLDKEKGLPLLLECASRICAVNGHVRFALAGGGALEGAIQRQIEERELQSRVRFLGYLEGPVLASFYRCADVVVIPSLYEPFGMVALEAMICGTAVVASDTGGLAEIIRHGTNGLLFPPGDAEALCSQVLTLLHDEPLRQHLADEGQAWAGNTCNWDGIARQTLAVYERALNASSGTEEI